MAGARTLPSHALFIGIGVDHFRLTFTVWLSVGTRPQVWHRKANAWQHVVSLVNGGEILLGLVGGNPIVGYTLYAPPGIITSCESNVNVMFVWERGWRSVGQYEGSVRRAVHPSFRH